VRVLVVEDEVVLADAVARGLRRTGMAVDVAYDGLDGHEKASITRYDVLVVDRDLPGMSGDDLTRALAKPFAFDELVARVRALGRRATPAAPPVLSAGDLVLDPARRTATRGGQRLDLTRKELGVLEVLLSAGGGVVSSEELLDRVWDENADPFTTTVRVTVMTLRRKLGAPPLIETVVGAGYRLGADGASAVP